MNLRFITLPLIACCLATTASAISVDLWTSTPDFCQFSSGSLYASVQGGVAPFTYDWYDVTDGAEVPFCLGCAPEVGGLTEMRSYKVVVTDAESVTAEAIGSVAGMAGLWLDVQGLPYLAGSPPMVLITSHNTFLDWEHPTIVVEPEPVFLYEAEFTTDGYATDRAVLPVGTAAVSVSGWVTSPFGTCLRDAWAVIDAPTVLPGIDVVEVTGSCSNAPTGAVEVVFTNAVNPSSLSVLMRPEGSTGDFLSNYYVGNVPAATSVQTFTGFAPGNYWLIVTGQPLSLNISVPGYTYDCRDSVLVTIPDLGSICGVVSGKIFLDTDLSCTGLYTEPGIPNTVLEVLPGPYYTSTNAGAYSLVLPNGNYTIREQSAVVDEHCTEAPIPFTIAGAATPVTVNHPTVSLVPLDVEITLGSGAARPGFEFAYAINVTNRTVSNTGTVTVTMQLDPALTYLGAVPIPTTVSGGTLSWTLSAMPTFQERNITIRTQVPPDVAILGTDLISTATVSTALTDAYPANNSSTITRTVTGSYDPNDKLAYTSGGSTTHYDPAQDQWIDYTIRFQNTGTDTAFNILITDTLAANLDPATINIGAASHAYTWELRGAGILKFRFYNILLPDSTINEPRSHGFVSFRISPRLPLAPGASIANTANIYFDFNPPVITPPSVLQVPLPNVLVNAKVLLGGVAGAGTGTMIDALRTQALLPTVDPYTALGYAHVNAVGNGTVLPAVFTATGANAVVDWVVVELRSTTAPYARVATRSALMQRDGEVVDLDGISAVSFSVPVGNYRVAVRHRNHLGVMTNSAYALSATPTAVDLTLAGTAVYGTNARTSVNGRLCLWPGDANFDGIARYTGTTNDRDLILTAVGGSVPTSVLTAVYNTRDVNLDGNVRYTGTGNDRDFILTTVGGTVPTAVRTQQLP